MEIKQVIALNDQNEFIGTYAVNPDDVQLPGVEHAYLVDMSDSALPTGKFVTVPVDPEFPEGETKEVELLDWPTHGWKFEDNQWIPPNLNNE